jgi:FkbM family methyltransferase
MRNPFEEILFLLPRRFKRYRAWLGTLVAAKIVFLEIRRKRTYLDLIFDDQPIRVRTCTTDLEVAAHAFLRREFEQLPLNNPLTIIDAGANIGASSISFAKRFPQARVIAIEPDPETYALLVENCRSYKNINPIHAALCAQDGPVTLYGELGKEWAFTITKERGNIKVTVPGLTLDTLMQEKGIQHVDFLKLDIEGSEREVMANSGKWIDRVGAISAELHDGAALGASRAFYLATANWTVLKKFGEKIFIQQ